MVGGNLTEELQGHEKLYPEVGGSFREHNRAGKALPSGWGSNAEAQHRDGKTFTSG